MKTCRRAYVKPYAVRRAFHDTTGTQVTEEAVERITEAFNDALVDLSELVGETSNGRRVHPRNLPKEVIIELKGVKL